jgi:mRNA interferase MazF
MNTFIKDFVKWFLVKTNIDSRIYNPPLFKEGQIWWCSIGENVGGEISGKGEYFRRPVLIIRKLDRFSFIGLPITSQTKTGSWYFNLKVNNQDNSIIMSQIRYIDYRRMDKIISTITADDLKIVRESLIELIRGL